jgi:hypothetical protein
MIYEIIEKLRFMITNCFVIVCLEMNDMIFEKLRSMSIYFTLLKLSTL